MSNKVTQVLRDYATKMAAEKAASPDRLTTADGQGGITTHKGTIPTDVGEGELTRDQPTNGTNRQVVAIPAGGPDRLTTADGQGGITAAGGTIPKDPGEEELKADQPRDGEVRKAATFSKRASGIRDALRSANPAFAASISAAQPTAPRATEPEKAASGVDNGVIDLSTSTLAKIASAILSTDAGVRYVHDTLEKQAGEDAARLQIREAIEASRNFDATEQVKSAAFDDLGHKVVEIHAALQSGGVTDDIADVIIKQAAFHSKKIDELAHPLLKQAYAQGMDDAALLAAADDAGAEGIEGAPPVEEAMPMGGEDLSEEEIMALLQEMIDSGQITEEDIMEAVAASGGGEVLAPEAAPAEEMVPV